MSEYTPTDAQVRDVYHLGLLDIEAHGTDVDVVAALVQFDHWLDRVKREAAADAFEEAATELDRVLTIDTTPWGDLPARDIGWYARHPMGGEPLVAPRDWLRARATSIRSGGTS